MKSNFSRNLEKEIKKRGLSPYTLSLELGLGKGTLQKLISRAGDPSLATAVRIAQGLQISLDVLSGVKLKKIKEVKEVQKPDTEIKSAILPTLNNQSLLQRICTLPKQDFEFIKSFISFLEGKNGSAPVKEKSPLIKKSKIVPALDDDYDEYDEEDEDDDSAKIGDEDDYVNYGEYEYLDDIALDEDDDEEEDEWN